MANTNPFLCPDPNEQPLEHIPSDGGYTTIFRTIACVGDSLASGEFESRDETGGKHYHDFFEHSWGQYLGRMCGSRVYNFSKGGMTAKDYCEWFADNKGFWNREYVAQAYIIALACNDLIGQHQEVGTISDICVEDWKKNKPTYAGYYATIIQRYKKLQPDAKFFLMTLPYEAEAEKRELADRQAELLYQLAELFSDCYVLDLRKYAPVYDQEFRDTFFLYGHMSPIGYVYTAKMVAAYIDYIIRHQFEEFREVGFIGTPYHTGNQKREVQS